MKNIAIFASGSGTNAEKIIEHFQNRVDVKINLVMSNRKDAYVLIRAQNHNVPVLYFNHEIFYKTEDLIIILEEFHIDLIVLAGFLWLIPDYMLKKYPDRIINIHPALLPNYGGKGMYGMKVHEAVIANNEKESGITIHYVNENYDEGRHIFRSTIPVDTNDTPDSLAEKIHKLEHEYYPVIIDKVLKELD